MTQLDEVEGIAVEVKRLVASGQHQWGVISAQPGITVGEMAALFGDLMTVNFGPIDPYMDQVIDAVRRGTVTPPPPPPPAAQFVSPCPPGAIYGKTKWLPGSFGCDLFLPRGTPIYAPADCIIEELIGGQGISGGAEMILSLPDHSWSWRYRHVQGVSGLRVGSRPTQGQQVGIIMDTSLDMLGNVPAWAVQAAGRPFPDKYQHLDLSVDKGTNQFAPTGGGGGNQDADVWMLQMVGYQGTLIERTPGPTDAGIGVGEAIRMMNPREGR